MNEQIKIDSAVLHILDVNVSSPVISKDLLDINEEVEVFLKKHIYKMFSDFNLQKATFINESLIQEVCGKFLGENINIIEASEAIASHLFNIMIKNIDIPSCDLIICHFIYNDIKNFGIFKLNYKTGYSHFVNHSEKGISNAIIIQRALLPVENQKVDEFCIINLEDMSISLIQKDYEINGVKEQYWSTLFLKCTSEFSSNKKLKIIEKAAKDVSKRHFEEDFTMIAQTKKVLAETLEEGNTVEISKIASDIFKDDEELKNEYIKELQKSGINEDAFEVPHNTLGKKLLNHRIKTDNGIEINFPAHYYNDKNKLEFINNVDGTISIVIKNIGIKV